MNNENTALQVLTDCQCYFDKIEEISGQFANGYLDNTQEMRKILNESTSIYLALNPLLSLAETEKSNREVIYYNKRKIEMEKANEKFVATAMDKEASAAVANYRRVRNILAGYVETLKVAISTCQSNLKSIGEENRITIPQQQG
jgi:hypothetical protein